MGRAVKAIRLLTTASCLRRGEDSCQAVEVGCEPRLRLASDRVVISMRLWRRRGLEGELGCGVAMWRPRKEVDDLCRGHQSAIEGDLVGIESSGLAAGS
jgi:hypothetical protein